MTAYVVVARWVGWLMVLAVLAVTFPAALATPDWCDTAPTSCITIQGGK